jgi:hypothetical protein
VAKLLIKRAIASESCDRCILIGGADGWCGVPPQLILFGALLLTPYSAWNKERRTVSYVQSSPQLGIKNLVECPFLRLLLPSEPEDYLSFSPPGPDFSWHLSAGEGEEGKEDGVAGTKSTVLSQ